MLGYRPATGELPPVHSLEPYGTSDLPEFYFDTCYARDRGGGSLLHRRPLVLLHRCRGPGLGRHGCWCSCHRGGLLPGGRCGFGGATPLVTAGLALRGCCAGGRLLPAPFILVAGGGCWSRCCAGGRLLPAPASFRLLRRRGHLASVELQTCSPAGRPLGCRPADVMSSCRPLGCRLADGKSSCRPLGCRLAYWKPSCRPLGCRLAHWKSSGRPLGCQLADWKSSGRPLGCRLAHWKPSGRPLGCRPLGCRPLGCRPLCDREEMQLQRVVAG